MFFIANMDMEKKVALQVDCVLLCSEKTKKKKRVICCCYSAASPGHFLILWQIWVLLPLAIALFLRHPDPTGYLTFQISTLSRQQSWAGATT